MHVRLLSFLFALLLPLPAAAQPMADTTIVLPDVTVTATRTATTTVTAPVRVTVLDAEAIEAAGAATVADLLERRAGVFIKRYGNGLASLSLRGTGASQTLVLLDGHRITDPQLGQLDLSLLPAILLGGVEVMHGPGSALYGTDGLGGVVNLRTVRAGEEPSARVQAGLGAYGERTGGLLLGGSQGPWQATLAAEYATSEGDFPYFTEALFPAQTVRRDNADLQRYALYTALAHRSNRGRTRMAAWYNQAERGLPGLAPPPSQDERQWDTNLRLWANHDRQLGQGTLRFGGLVQHSRLRYQNPAIQIDDTGRTLIGSLEAELRQVVGSRWLLAGGLSGGFGRALHPNLADGASAVHGSAFGHATGEYGRLRLYPALRLDMHAPGDAAARVALSPRLGANLRLLPSLPVHLKAGAGRSFRVPTFNQRFWQPGGNPDLRPEHGWTFDAGLAADAGGIEAEVTAFTSFITDQIVWEPTPQGYTPANVQRVRIRGLEASLRLVQPLTSWLHLTADGTYTLTDARDWTDPQDARTYDRPLRYVPPQQLKSQIDLGVGPLKVGLLGRYTGCRYIATDGPDYAECTEARRSKVLPPVWTFDASARLRIEGRRFGATLALSVVNLKSYEHQQADPATELTAGFHVVETYEVVKGYPMPPRHLRFQLTLDAGGRR